jgi:lipopolysaccharide export system permease protein
MAWMVVLAVPMAVLVSTLTTFGRMSADSEILAIKASGQNLFYLITPVFLASLLLTASLIFFHNLILPNANHRYASLRSDIARKKPAALIEPNILIKDFTNYAIIVKEVEHSTGIIKGIKIFSEIPGEDPATTIADSGTILLTKDEKYLQLTLFNGETHNTNKEDRREYFVGNFAKHMIFIPNIDSRLRRTDRAYRGDREKSTKELLADINGFKITRESCLQRHNDNLNAFISEAYRLDSITASGTVAVSSKVDSLNTFKKWLRALKKYYPASFRNLTNQQRRIGQDIQQIKRQDKKINQFLVEVHKKYSISFACIVFILIGIPLGIIARHGSMAVGITYSIFFFVLFWVFLIAGENLADRLIVPPGITMWSCNIIVGIFGIILTLRMIRETTFINYGPLIKLWHKITSPFKSRKRKRGIIAAIFIRFPTFLLNKCIGIIPSYLVRTFIYYMIIVFLSLIVVFVVIDYISNMRGFTNATFLDVVQYYWYYLAWFLGLIFPIGILLASMLAMVSLVKYSEFTAIKAAGNSFRRFTMPMLVLGVFLSFLSFYLSEKILPQANINRKQLWEDIRAGKPREERQKRKKYSTKDLKRDFFYFVKNDITYRFQEFRADPQMANGVRRERFFSNKIVEHTEAERMVYNDNNTWTFLNGFIKTFHEDSFTHTEFDTLSDNVLFVSPGEMTARLTTTSVDYMSYWELKDLIGKAKRRGEKISVYQADLNFKIALPFMNFIVMLLGLSITARAGRKGGAVSFGIGLGLVFTYWIAAQFLLALGKKEILDPIIASWAGNITFLLIGLILYRRASR